MIELYGVIQSMRPDQRLELSTDNVGNVCVAVRRMANTPQERRETWIVHKDDIRAKGDKAIVDVARNLLRMY